MSQIALFDTTPAYPEGFRYEEDILSSATEQDLLAQIPELPFREFEFHGYTGKRRVVSFGWKYDFSARTLDEVAPIPSYLLPVRDLAASFAGLTPEALEHVLVTEYSPGAAIGWHKDKAVFGDIVGISLKSACTFRLRRAVGDRWERVNVIAKPRSAYLLRGASRTEWEHSIPAVDELRYSLTFRTRVGGTP
ncbi:MAG TPA: alpha-ketoglutarate-dependent dioxygenase AlkB [Gemmatimonadaceae bacterium]|nr:alpha-ketoglutarate-dependent dioxygenase AlkB [Gemmatimonadaceae bacterium]